MKVDLTLGTVINFESGVTGLIINIDKASNTYIGTVWILADAFCDELHYLILFQDGSKASLSKEEIIELSEEILDVEMDAVQFKLIYGG